MKTDQQLKKDVSAELEWDPSINATRVGVAVKDGIVTLTGQLQTFAEKHAAERAVQRVHGVKGIAVELDVKLDPSHQRNDAEIAAAIESALKWHALVPADKVQVQVEKGWVTLGGEVPWDHQRREAEKTTRTLTGVVGVSNAIRLKAAAMPADVSQRIRDALVRHAEGEARQLDVTVEADTVTLRGSVDSWVERAAASSAAWSAPGVAKVVNDIRIQR